MISFICGPAAGKILMLRRMPYFLRVVIDGRGTIDALDQLSDRPRDGETIYVYRRQKFMGNAHVSISRGRGGFFKVGEYQYFENQPAQSEVFDQDNWVSWCFAHAPADWTKQVAT